MAVWKSEGLGQEERRGSASYASDADIAPAAIAWLVDQATTNATTAEDERAPNQGLLTGAEYERVARM